MALTPSTCRMNTSAPANADADVLRVGQCTVTMSSREVQVPGVRRVRRLTPKAVGVLRLLVAHQGRVVTREELFAEVWPDTAPTNDVLTQAVTQLRKAFAQDGEPGNGYIETIAKTGYRLLVPVTAAEASPVAADPDTALTGGEATASVADPVTVQPRRHGRWRRIRRFVYLGIGLCMLVALLVMAAVLVQRQAPRSALDAAVDDGRVVGSPQRPYRLITATGGFETYPSLSPDGSQVAYEGSDADGEGGVIKVQTSGNAPSRNLIEPVAGALDRFPTWSPDGREIAFARFHHDGGCQVLIAAATGGNLRQAARCDGTELLSFDWTPDGRGLVFGSMVGRYAHRGIRVLDLASGTWKVPAYSVGSDDFDYAPRFSPDGRWLVFVRNPQLGDLWMMPAEGGPLQPLTDDAAEIRGWAWRGDGRAIVFGRRVDSEVRLYQLEIQSRQIRDLGLDDAQWPSIARRTDSLAFVRRKAQFGLFEVPLAAPEQAKRLFASGGRDSQPVVAPDGQHFVFASDRSGSYALWWADLRRPDSLRLVQGLRPDARQAPDWSADSRQLLVVGRDDHGVARVYEISPRDEQASALAVPVARPIQALYTDNPQHLLLVERDDQLQTRLALYDRSERPWRLLGSVKGVSQARFDRHGRRVLFSRFGASGLWSIDSALTPSSLRQVSADAPGRWRYRNWSSDAGGQVVYLDSTFACASRLSTLESQRDMAARCLDVDRLPTGNGFSISPDGAAVYVSLAVSDGAGIGLMALPAAPPSLFSVMGNVLIQNEK